MQQHERKSERLALPCIDERRSTILLPRSTLAVLLIDFGVVDPAKEAHKSMFVALVRVGEKSSMFVNHATRPKSNSDNPD